MPDSDADLESVTSLPKMHLVTKTTIIIKQVTWLPSPRYEVQSLTCLPVCRGPLVNVITTLYYVTLYYVSATILFLAKCGIARFLCAVRVFEVRPSSSPHKLPLCKIVFLLRPLLLSQPVEKNRVLTHSINHPAYLMHQEHTIIFLKFYKGRKTAVTIMTSTARNR